MHRILFPRYHYFLESVDGFQDCALSRYVKETSTIRTTNILRRLDSVNLNLRLIRPILASRTEIATSQPLPLSLLSPGCVLL